MDTTEYGTCTSYSAHCLACQAAKPVRELLRSKTGRDVHIATHPGQVLSLCAPFGRMGARPMNLFRTQKFTEATCKTCLKIAG